MMLNWTKVTVLGLERVMRNSRASPHLRVRLFFFIFKLLHPCSPTSINPRLRIQKERRLLLIPVSRYRRFRHLCFLSNRLLNELKEQKKIIIIIIIIMRRRRRRRRRRLKNNFQEIFTENIGLHNLGIMEPEMETSANSGEECKFVYENNVTKLD